MELEELKALLELLNSENVTFFQSENVTLQLSPSPLLPNLPGITEAPIDIPPKTDEELERLSPMLRKYYESIK